MFLQMDVLVFSHLMGDASQDVLEQLEDFAEDDGQRAKMTVPERSSIS